MLQQKQPKEFGDLGLWVQIFFISTSKIVKDEPILTNIFFKWVGSTTQRFGDTKSRQLGKKFSPIDRGNKDMKADPDLQDGNAEKSLGGYRWLSKKKA